MQERRDYFRIEDDIFLSYKVLAAEKEGAAVLPRTRLPSDLVEEINELSRRSAPLFKSVQKKQPEVARYLQVLNEKIDALAAHIAGTESREGSAPNHHVSLSASGIAFGAAQALAKGARLELRMRLYPSHRQIIALGEVVDASPDHPIAAAYPVRVAVRFRDMAEADHEALVEHILMRQFDRRRQARQNTVE